MDTYLTPAVTQHFIDKSNELRILGGPIFLNTVHKKTKACATKLVAM